MNLRACLLWLPAIVLACAFAVTCILSEAALMLLAVFGTGAAPFTDARYLGHEARETLTHTLPTVPLAVVLCAYLSGPASHHSGRRLAWISAAGFLAPAYQAGGAIAGRRGKP